MLPLDDLLLESYRAVALQCIAAGDEAAMDRAYELGKQHFAAGYGISELVRLHHEALDSLLALRPQERTQLIDSGKRVLGELLSYLDGELRRLRDYQVEQRLLNEQLRQQARALDQTNEALRLAMAKVEDASRTKANFLANMSHEVRWLTFRRWLRLESARGSDCGSLDVQYGLLIRFIMARPSCLGSRRSAVRCVRLRSWRCCPVAGGTA